MIKLILALFLAVVVSANVYDGVAVVVKGSAITLLDIKKEMKASKLDAKAAADILIRKKLEESERKERGITVSSSEVYDDIKKLAQRNRMSVSQFYDAVRESNGLSSSELKKKIREKLLSQKLYSAVAMSSMAQPSEDEIQEYYELHKESFANQYSYDVIIYESKDGRKLQEKINNPMLYMPEVLTRQDTLSYASISPELAKLLNKTEVSHFTPVVPDGRGGFMSFYIKSRKAEQGGADMVRDQIITALMAQKREQVLGDYFAKLRDRADINIIRMPE